MTKQRILIVEDQMITAMDEQQCLESLGYEVTGIVASGEEAIKRAEVDRPDLVLMDITLEGEMDGIEAAGKIHDAHNIPVIFVTAHGDKTLFESASYHEFAGYIVKPFDIESLKVNIERALKR
jgi:two-component system, response regulator PdtaR